MGEIQKFGLQKNERLHDVKLIESLFKTSKTFKAYPLIFSYNYAENSLKAPFSFIFTVSKRKFKRAVDRNRIKRLLRDRLRLQRIELLKALSGRQIYGAFIFTPTQLPDYKSLDISISKFIQFLNEENRR